MRLDHTDAYGQELDAALRAMLGFAVVLAAAAAAALTLTGAARPAPAMTPAGCQPCTSSSPRGVHLAPVLSRPCAGLMCSADVGQRLSALLGPQRFNQRERK